MQDEPSAKLRAICLALAIAAGGLVPAAPAHAWPTLREGLFGRHSSALADAPPVGRYVSEDGEAFVLDLTQARPLLKFENNPEVWALTPHPAPRGDVIYKNDLGQPVLRATRLGGLTIFTDQRPSGSAAALSGDAAPLRLAPMGPQALLERLAQSSARASHAAHRLIPFDADASPTSSSLIADAAMVTSEALVHMARSKADHAQLARVRRVRLMEGRHAAVQLVKGTLEVVVEPAEGLAGRPSSERILLSAAR